MNIFFQVSIILSNIFGLFIKNLVMYFAILVYFDSGYVCLELPRGSQDGSLMHFSPLKTYPKILLQQNFVIHLQKMDLVFGRIEGQRTDGPTEVEIEIDIQIQICYTETKNLTMESGFLSKIVVFLQCSPCPPIDLEVEQFDHQRLIMLFLGIKFIGFSIMIPLSTQVYDSIK